MIVITGTTTPVAAFSLVVRPGEMFSAAEVILGLEILRFGPGYDDVAEVDGIVIMSPNESVVMMTCARFVVNLSCIAFPLQLVMPSRDWNRFVTLDPKAVGSAAAGLVTDNSGTKSTGLPVIATQIPFDLGSEVNW